MRRSLADPATLRTRVEETGLLWGLVGLVALLALAFFLLMLAKAG